MKIMKIISIALTFLLIGSSLSVLFFLEEEDYSDGLVWIIHQFSDFQIEAIDITSIDIANTSTIVAKNISVTMGSSEQRITAEFVEVQLALLSLFSQRLDIKKLIVQDANIVVSTQIESYSLDSDELFIPTIEHAEFINVLVSCQCQNDKQLELKIENISIYDADHGEIRLSGEGEFEQTSFHLNGRLGSPSQLNQQDPNFPVDIAFQFSDASFVLQGNIEDPIELEGFDLAFTGEVEELANIVQHFITKQPTLGKAHLDFVLSGDWDNLHITDLNAQLNNNTDIDVRVDGTIDHLLNEPEVDLHIAGNISKPLITQLGVSNVPAMLSGVKFDGLVDMKDNFATVEQLDLQLSFGNNISINANGNGQFNLTGIYPSISKFDLAITAESGSTTAVTSLLGQQFPDLGQFSLNAKVALIDKLVSLSDINIVVGSENKLKVMATGELEKFTFGDDFYETVLELDIALSGENIDHLIPAKGKLVQLAGIGSLSAKLNLSGSINKSELNIENIMLSHNDGITLQGQGKVQFGDIRQSKSLNHVLLHLESHVNKMEALSPWFDAKLPLLGLVKASATLQGQQQYFSLKDLNIKVGDKSSVWVETRGDIEKIYYTDDVIWSGLEMETKFQAKNLNSIADYLELSLPEIEQANGDFKLSGNSDSLAITDLNVIGTNLTGIQIIGKGSIKNSGLLKSNKLSGIDINLIADAESNISLDAIIGQELPDLGRLHITARLSDHQNELGLENIVLTLGDSQKHALHASGQIHNILNDHKLNLSAHMETEASTILEHILDKDIPDMGLITANISVSNHDGSLGIESLEVSASSAGLYQLTATGIFDDLRVGDELKFNLDLAIPKPQLLGDKLGYEVADFESIHFVGHIEGDNEKSVFEGDINIGKTHFESDIVASYIDSHPALKGSLHTQHLDLNDIAIHHEKYIPDVAGEKAVRLFSSQALPFDLVKNIDLDIHISVDEINGTQFNIDRADAHVQIDNNVLVINPASFIFDGGFVQMEASIAVDSKQPEIKLDVQANDIDIGQFVSQFIENHSIDGELTTHMNFSGSGHSIAEIAASLDGDVAVALDNGVLHEANLALLNIDFLGWFFDHLIQKKQTDIHCAMSHHQIKRGLAELKMLMIATPDLEASGEGSINLKNEMIDLTIYTDNKSIFKPSIPISVRGNLSKPTVTVLPSINTLTSLILSVVPQAILADIALSKFWNLLNEGDVNSKCEAFLPDSTY